MSLLLFGSLQWYPCKYFSSGSLCDCLSRCAFSDSDPFMPRIVHRSKPDCRHTFSVCLLVLASRPCGQHVGMFRYWLNAVSVMCFLCFHFWFWLCFPPDWSATWTADQNHAELIDLVPLLVSVILIGIAQYHQQVWCVVLKFKLLLTSVLLCGG